MLKIFIIFVSLAVVNAECPDGGNCSKNETILKGSPTCTELGQKCKPDQCCQKYGYQTHCKYDKSKEYSICKNVCVLNKKRCESGGLPCCHYNYTCNTGHCIPCTRNGDPCNYAKDCCYKNSKCVYGYCKGCMYVGQQPSELEECRRNADCCDGQCGPIYKGHCQNKPNTNCVNRGRECFFNPQKCCGGLSCKPADHGSGVTLKTCQASEDYPIYPNYPDNPFFPPHYY